jgi:hypothetical protein
MADTKFSNWGEVLQVQKRLSTTLASKSQNLENYTCNLTGLIKTFPKKKGHHKHMLPFLWCALSSHGTHHMDGLGGAHNSAHKTCI